MAFKNTVLQYVEQLQKRPIAIERFDETREVDVGGVRKLVAMKNEVPRDRQLVRSERRIFRRDTLKAFRKLSSTDKFKLSVLVRAAQSSDTDVMLVAQYTSFNDKSCLLAKAEKLLAGLALAEAQNIDLDADWGQGAKLRVGSKKS